MTRRSRRELERAVDDLAGSRVPGDRPPELPTAEKRALADLFDVEPWGDNPDLHAALAEMEGDT